MLLGSIFRNGKFNPERTLSGIQSYLEELILLMTGCMSEWGKIEFSPRESTGWVQRLDEEEWLVLGMLGTMTSTLNCPADEGYLQSVEVGLLCPCVIISVVCALDLPPTCLTSSVHQWMPLSSATVAGAAGVEGTSNVFQLYIAGLLILWELSLGGEVALTRPLI